MSDELIEAVEKAIIKASSRDPFNISDGGILDGVAKAAITAHLKHLADNGPTKEMIDSGVAFALNVKLPSEYTWSQYVADLFATMVRASQEGEG